MISSTIQYQCSKCNKAVTVVDKNEMLEMTTLSCGHMTYDNLSNSIDYNAIESQDGLRPMPFQIDGIKFAERANGRCLIGDEQGLGKTIQADVLLSLHPEMYPAVLVTKSAIKVQHLFEARRWIKTNKIQVLFSGKEIAVPGMDLYVTSYDMLKEEKVWAYIEPKTLILDECQKIKNHTSGRYKAAKGFSDRESIEHVLGLSGTAIMNNAGEYFGVLSIIRPDMFSDYNRFVRDHCDSYTNMYGTKVGGLSNPDYFHEYTKDIIIRRTLEQVMPDLFKLKLPRKFQHVELDKKVTKAYDSALDELEELFYADKQDNTAIIAIMTRLRQICGVSKVFECTDFIEEFLEGTSRKIVIFAHHHIAVDLLEKNINQILDGMNLHHAIMVRAGDDSKSKIELFKDDKSRVMICSGIAAGEGMDGLQFICNDMIMLERQWNPAIEEQIESRLIRYGQELPVNVTYLIAIGTIDEYFTELVEQKRAIKSSTLDNKEIEWEAQNLMKDLAEILIIKGKKRWSL